MIWEAGTNEAGDGGAKGEDDDCPVTAAKEEEEEDEDDEEEGKEDDEEEGKEEEEEEEGDENFSMKNFTASSKESFENLAPFTPSCGIDDLEAII